MKANLLAVHPVLMAKDVLASVDPTDRPAYRFLVADVDAMYYELLEGGSVNATTSQGSPWSFPAETPWGTREFHLRDPGQNSLQFYQAL